MARAVHRERDRAATHHARLAHQRGRLTRATFFVPGRIEVLGKHTDYAGGRSLLCAVERGITASVEPRRDAVVEITDAGRRETRTLALREDLESKVGDWSNYVAAVVRRVARNFPDAENGAKITFTSDLPVASGMSSSTALTIAVFLALDATNALSQHPQYRTTIDSTETLAAYLGSVEMGGDFGDLRGDVGVGTFGGSEDHTAILCCRADYLSQYSFIPTRKEREVQLPRDRTFIVAFCGVAAEKTGSALASYNEASLGVRRIVTLWNDATRRADVSLAAAVASSPNAKERIRDMVGAYRGPEFKPERLRERFDQFVLESDEIIPRATDALARGDFREFGALVGQSHDAAETMLRNQIPETMRLVRIARELSADAASAFGAGFGGSVWALVKAADAAEFIKEWRGRYVEEFPQHASRAEFFITRPGPAATALS